ncbi:class I SAM-dependent methyltransferase [Vallitalea okinawensis]|uniref:class I SAM-dependent methyltransferase n=1 Tax=Vallitalea okinawensis TaxID=2078660 RepID=UPI000CFD20FC|nr:class I SAM-dependent methyltransferase [Vallitalea okinawensis]
MKEDIIKSFNRIALLEDNWDHNQHYKKLLIKEVDNIKGIGLDIGCGTGEFTEKFANKVSMVYGIDLSPIMIEEAKKRHSSKNIKYVVQDFDELDEEIRYDYIVSIATFHHLELQSALPKVKRLLKDNGVLIVLDLYERKGLIDSILDFIAVPTNLIVKRIKCGRFKDNREEIEAWEEHSHIDNYMEYGVLKKIYRQYLSGNIKIKRLLYWRYLMVYRKEG